MTVVETDVPARLDRLPWARFHWLVLIGLGVAWILDGLEVTLVGSLSGAIAQSPVLHMSASRVGDSASAYLAGAVIGALGFGWLADRLGRKRLFGVTVLIYLSATLATGFAWSFASFVVFRALTGAGIGGEYTAVNAAIQEMIPARQRGFADLVVNGSFWIGAAIGAGGSLIALDPHMIPPGLGWRIAFGLGGILGLGVLLLRRWIPESPRWLMTHGEPELAEQVVRQIETSVEVQKGLLPPVPPERLRLRTDVKSWFGAGMVALATRYRQRTMLGLVLMASQAFCYNAVFFTYALILTRFYGVRAGAVGLFILPFAVGNFLGPLLLGKLFDVLGRRVMIAGTYAASGVLMALSGWLFARRELSAIGQTETWTAIFFVASAAASSAYLTVGESFPLEIRAVAIALFYAFGTLIGGVGGPALFGALIQGGSRTALMWGYELGALLMLAAAGMAWALGIAAERRSLEAVAPPLAATPDYETCVRITLDEAGYF